MTPPAAPKPRGFGAGVDKAPHPLGPVYRLRAVAVVFGRSIHAMHKALYRHAERFDQPMYQRDVRPPHRLYRVLSERDVQVLAQLWPIYVKRKVSGPQ